MSALGLLAAAVIAGAVNVAATTTTIQTANTGSPQGGGPPALLVENGTVGPGIDLFVSHIGGQGAIYFDRSEGSSPPPGVQRNIAEVVWEGRDSAGARQDYAILNAEALDNTAGVGKGYLAFAVQNPAANSQEPSVYLTVTPASVNVINGAVLKAPNVVTTTTTTTPVTVSALLPITPVAGMRAFVIDSTMGAFGAPIGITGGGSFAEPVHYYGGKWLVG